MKLTISESEQADVTIVDTFFYPGDWGCSRCGKDLDGVDFAISELWDIEEGQEWRAFCPGCQKFIGLNKNTNPDKLERIYNKYPPSIELF